MKSKYIKAKNAQTNTYGFQVDALSIQTTAENRAKSGARKAAREKRFREAVAPLTAEIPMEREPKDVPYTDCQKWAAINLILNALRRKCGKPVVKASENPFIG